jgi:predicted acyl esterase
MSTILIEKNVMVPMRDGVRLATDVYRMEGGKPAPVLLARTPYDRERILAGSDTFDILRAMQAGYTVVAQDVRGRYASEGILRARYRNSFTVPELLEPDAIYELQLDLWATANVFLPGHRIRLEVSSSNFPRFDRNSNTGGEIASETADQYRPAINRIFHDAAHPSRLILPIIER